MATQSIDGNFHQQLKKKKHDPNNTELIYGAYFPNTIEYEDYLNCVGDSTEVSFA